MNLLLLIIVVKRKIRVSFFIVINILENFIKYIFYYFLIRKLMF